MARKKEDPFGKLACGGCKQYLPLRDYTRGWPPPSDADPSKVHWVFFRKAPPRGMFCFCGHWTGWSPYFDEKSKRVLPGLNL